ncbi:MAG: DUF1735 domain-containing protein [Bacteroidaceae bacterium]|nr:DUF1735 domain-containing protein [Bacteroidaceae bacterium]
MKKSFIIASIVCLGGLSMLQTSCDNYDDLIPEQYNCILSLQQYGEQDMVLYRTGVNTEFEITTLKTGNVPTSTAAATITPMTEVQFAEYMAMTGKNYKYLPTECYDILEGSLSYAEADKWKKTKVSIKYDETERYFNGADQYVIPIYLTSESDSCLSSRRELMLKISDMIVPSIGFEETVINYGEDLIGDGTVEVEIPVVMPVDNLWDFSFDVEVDETAAAGYAVANEAAYTVEEVAFVAGENAKVKLTIDKSALDFGLQAIPLRIKSCDNENFEISSSNSTAVVTFHKTVLRSELSEITVTEDKIDGWGWATWQEAPGGGYYFGYAWGANIFDGYGKSALFDGNLATHWHGDWGYGSNHEIYGQYIDFELPAAANHFAYDLWVRAENPNGAPKVTDIYGSADGSTWTKLKTIESVLTQGGQKFESSVCSSATPFNHIRFAVVQSNAGDVRVAYKYWNCAEMKLYAK